MVELADSWQAGTGSRRDAAWPPDVGIAPLTAAQAIQQAVAALRGRFGGDLLFETILNEVECLLWSSVTLASRVPDDRRAVYRAGDPISLRQRRSTRARGEPLVVAAPAPATVRIGQWEGLTNRQIEISRALLNGVPVKEIARSMGIGIATVHKHLEHIYVKTGVHSQVAALAVLRSRWQEVPLSPALDVRTSAY